MRECREIEKAVELYQGRPRQPTSPVPRSQKDSNMAAPLNRSSCGSEKRHDVAAVHDAAAAAALCPRGRHRQRRKALICFIRWIAAGFIRQPAHLIYGSKTRCLGDRFGGCRTGLKLTIFART